MKSDMNEERFAKTLLAIVGIVAALAILRGPGFGPQSTTKVNNLVITGTTDATGNVAMHAGLGVDGTITQGGVPVGDITAVNAGVSLSGGGSSGAVTLDVNLPAATCTGNTVGTALSTAGALSCAAPPTFTTTSNGYVPAPGSVAGKVLSDNGNWVTNGGSTTSSTVGTITDTGSWTNGFNITTEGTRDWAAYSQAACNSPLQGNIAWTSLQSKPWTSDVRAGRLYQGVFYGCDGSGNCNGTTVGAAGTYGGNGISTSTGAGNFAGSALSALAQGCDIATSSSNGAFGGIRFHLFPGESAFTLAIYIVTVDFTASTQYRIIENGAVVSTVSGSVTSTTGATVLHKITVVITPGTAIDSWFEFRYKRTATPTNFNPHGILVAATMF